LGQNKEVHVYWPILEDKTKRIERTFDQLLDELMEGKKGLAQDALRGDEFLHARASEEESGLKVFEGLESSSKSHSP
jgi:hypothetical protein